MKKVIILLTFFVAIIRVDAMKIGIRDDSFSNLNQSDLILHSKERLIDLINGGSSVSGEPLVSSSSSYVKLLSSNLIDNLDRTQVRYLQKELNAVMKCNLDTDGIIGSITKNCIIDFQRLYGLDPDGLVGTQTRTKLNRVYKYQKAIVSVSGLNIRNVAGTVGTNIIGRLNKGDIISIIDKKVVNGETWYKMKYNNIIGYVFADYTIGKFIEVDVVSQTLRLYKNNQLYLDTVITTGKKGTHDTTKGYYSVMFIDTQRTLKPYNAFVNYWMRFNDAEALGIHDASWRGTEENFTYFGGTIYKNSSSAGSRYSGSHGCVNVPLSKMKLIYSNAGLNTPVFVH